jgi:hypothetical protein
LLSLGMIGNVIAINWKWRKHVWFLDHDGWHRSRSRWPNKRVSVDLKVSSRSSDRPGRVCGPLCDACSGVVRGKPVRGYRSL